MEVYKDIGVGLTDDTVRFDQVVFAQRPRPEEEFLVDKQNTRFYPRLNFS